MTKIKTATANYMHGDGLLNVRGWPEDDRRDLPVVIVHGLTEAEVHEAAALLELHEGPNFCPSCGRKVEVK